MTTKDESESGLSVSSRVRDYLEQWAHDHPDERFTSKDVQAALSLAKGGAVAATLNRFTRLGVVKPVAKKRVSKLGKACYVFEVMDEHFAVSTRTKAPRPHDANRPVGSVHYSERVLPNLNPPTGSVEAASHLFDYSVPGLAPAPALEKSVVEMALDLAVAVERLASHPDLTRVSTQDLLAEVRRRVVVDRNIDWGEGY